MTDYLHKFLDSPPTHIGNQPPAEGIPTMYPDGTIVENNQKPFTTTLFPQMFTIRNRRIRIEDIRGYFITHGKEGSVYLNIERDSHGNTTTTTIQYPTAQYPNKADIAEDMKRLDKLFGVL